MLTTLRRTSALLPVLLLCLLSLPGCSSSTPAEVVNLNGFKITLSEPDIDFPDSIVFNIEVESDIEISEITFQYQVDMRTPLPVTGVAFPDFEPDTRVKTGWNWNMLRSGGLPPGAGIDYWWSIEDAQGNTVETEPEEVSFNDEGHSWNSLANGQITVYWYDGNPSFASSLMNAAQQAVVSLNRDTGVGLERETEIYIYSGSQDLREALIYPQEWTGGVAFTEFSTITIGISPGNLDWGKEAIAHELTHLAVHDFIFNGYGVQLPTWLDEGLAMYAQGALSSSYQDVLEYAVKNNELFSVKSLSSSFPTQGNEARLGYAQSHSLVEYLLLEKGGQANMLKLLTAFRQGSSYIDALDTVYGLDVEQLNTLWLEYIKD